MSAISDWLKYYGIFGITGKIPTAVFSSFPGASSVVDGTQYYATDMNVLYVSNGANWLPSVNQNSNYFFQGYAGNQIAGDASFYDISGQYNDGVLGSSYTASSYFSSSGYITCAAPATGSSQSGVYMPNFNFDNQGGQSFIFWWLGIGAAPGSTLPWAGDGFNSSTPGVYIRTGTTGKVQMVLIDGTSSQFSGTASSATFNGSLNSFGIYLQGKNGTSSQLTYSFWENEALDASNANISMSSYVANTKNSSTFNLGTSIAASSGSLQGMAIQTRAFALFKLPSTKIPPSTATVTNLFKQLRRSPWQLLTNSAF